MELRKPIILRTLERLASEQTQNPVTANEGACNEPRASKPDDFLNRLIAEGAAEAHTSEAAEALTYMQEVLAAADKLEHSQNITGNLSYRALTKTARHL
jgi:hypothetical protein